MFIQKKMFIGLLLAPFFSYGQSIDSLYKKADTYRDKFATKFYYGVSEVGAVDKSHSFWYLTQTPKGYEFLLLDADSKSSKPAFDQEKLANSLATLTSGKIKPYQLPFRTIAFNDKNDSLFFTANGQRYTCSLSNYTIVKRDKVKETPYWGDVAKESSKEKVKSPDNKKEAYISEYNLWVTDLSTGKSKQLSFDGTPKDYYSSNINWSPDSKKIVSCKYHSVETRKLVLISSSPKDQLQPKMEEYDYPKPGDSLPVRRPVVFIPEENKIVRVDVPEVESQFDLSDIRWEKNNNFFTFSFNKRGSQQFIVYRADATSGNLQVVVNETSSTFVYYNTLYLYWFENGKELLWISNRDGWRHLYLYDVASGKVKKQLTKGEWVVKTVVNVNEKTRTAILKVCGKDAGEDPYLEKYYSLNIDNGKLTALTPENANHNVTFSSDYAYMLDNYSRVDLTPTVVLRSVKNGAIVYKPEKQPDISSAVLEGWRVPEVFSAKGRDGKTDIWGMIVRPTDFDPKKKYPVIEYIYAGPHDSFVPKSFAIAHRFTELAELGFITVMIDGMGTDNRSKAFHDVCWKNLKDAGFPDRIAWMKAAAEKHPEMDISRVGIYGASAGGQSSTGALLFHPEFYKVGVSSCGCHDNRMDKIWWNEQWMGYPVGKEYEECSNVVNAHLLQGKLMLIVGELDNNVDPSSTYQVADQLIKYNKEFELVVLPGARHTLGENYGERKRRDFFVKNLLGLKTPEWNTSK